MGLFHRDPHPVRRAYDPARRSPALRCSICTGEQVAGFRDLDTGRFVDVTLIRSPADLTAFCEEYGVDPAKLEKIY